MTPFRLVLGATLALALSSQAPVAAAAPKAAPETAAVSETDIEPEAVAALARMSAYLATLTAFDIRAQTSLDLVMTDGQKLKLDGNNRYTVRRPDAFAIEVATPLKVRRLIYDGKTLTLFAPELGVYATVPAPATIRETMVEADARYGLVVPLVDLFRWMDPAQKDREPLLGAMVVVPSKIDGVDCDHYAYREGEVDWQLWIEKGARPLPRRIVIVDRQDPTHPQFEARLDWDIAPKLTSDSFAFHPDKNVMAIRLTSAQP